MPQSAPASAQRLPSRLCRSAVPRAPLRPSALPPVPPSACAPHLCTQLSFVVGTVTVLQYNPCPALLPCHNTPIILRYNGLTASPSQGTIQNCIVTHFPFQASLLYCNTVLCIAIQCLNSLTLLLQYNFYPIAHPRQLYHNTMPFLQYNWAVAQIIFYTPFFFSFFFSLFILHLFQPLENTKKIYTYIFFFSIFKIL